MKAAVVGSRNYSDYDSFSIIMNDLVKKYGITAIVSGGATGADSLASVYAYNNNIRIIVYKAEWDDMTPPCVRRTNRYGKEYNALAGVKRNTTIVENSDMVIAFWDLKSTGTRDTIRKARASGKNIVVYNVRDFVEA